MLKAIILHIIAFVISTTFFWSSCSHIYDVLQKNVVRIHDKGYDRMIAFSLSRLYLVGLRSEILRPFKIFWSSWASNHVYIENKFWYVWWWHDIMKKCLYLIDAFIRGGLMSNLIKNFGRHLVRITFKQNQSIDFSKNDFVFRYHLIHHLYIVAWPLCKVGIFLRVDYGYIWL